MPFSQKNPTDALRHEESIGLFHTGRSVDAVDPSYTYPSYTQGGQRQEEWLSRELTSAEPATTIQETEKFLAMAAKGA